MKITDIEIKNFEGLYGSKVINLDNDGKNVVVYGENGSGKSSLYDALKTFFESSSYEVSLADKENIFLGSEQRGDSFIKVYKKEDSEEPAYLEIYPGKSFLNEADTTKFYEANKIKGFLDYKSLLKTYLIDLHTDKVNIFDLLINGMLRHSINPETNYELGKSWDKITELTFNRRQGRRVVEKIKNEINSFNNGLSVILKEIETEVNRLIQYFDGKLTVEFQFEGLKYIKKRNISGQSVTLNIEFCGEKIEKHQYFLNEARLSALAIATYLATLLNYPSQRTYRILFLDDLLIGLDMNNRIPLLNLIKDHFEDNFQIFLTTYDKVWYEVIRNYFGESKWKFLEMYTKKVEDQDFEIPVIFDGKSFIDSAIHHYRARDYKASAVYIRTEFERIVKHYCHKFNLPVKYDKNSKRIQSSDFWDSITSNLSLNYQIKNDIELHRRLVMNPYSHYNPERPEFKRELEDTINAVENLKKHLESILK